MATTSTKKTTTTKKSTTKAAAPTTSTAKADNTSANTTTNTTANTTANTTTNNKPTAEITALQNEVNNLRQEIMMMKETLTGGGGSDTSRIAKLETQINGLGAALRNSVLKRADVNKTWKLRGFLDDLGL